MFSSRSLTSLTPIGSIDKACDPPPIQCRCVQVVDRRRRVRQQQGRVEGDHVDGVQRLVERNTDVTLGAQVVDLVRLHIANDGRQ